MTIQFRQLLAALPVLVATAVLTGCPTPGPVRPDVLPAPEGKPAAELQATYVSGDGPKTLAEAKGKVVIVDFWATYCDPCRKSFPKYQELVDQFGGDLAVIAISVDEPSDVGEDKLKAFAEETQVKFPILWDKEHKTVGAYNPPNMPTSYVIDKEGNIRHTHAKYESGEEEKIANEVRALLGK